MRYRSGFSSAGFPFATVTEAILKNSCPVVVYPTQGIKSQWRVCGDQVTSRCLAVLVLSRCQIKPDSHARLPANRNRRR